MEKGMEKRKGLELRGSTPDAERGNQQKRIRRKERPEGRGRPGESVGRDLAHRALKKRNPKETAQEEMRAWARSTPEGPGWEGPCGRCYHPQRYLEEIQGPREVVSSKHLA